MGRAGSTDAPKVNFPKDPLGDRMKSLYENATRHYLPERTYTIVRCDGRSFSSYTRGLDKPFDLALMEAMKDTTRFLCSEISGCLLGYVQSDEISLLMVDFAKEQTQAWFGGNLQKVVSVSASLAAGRFNRVYQHPKRPDALASFDARVFTIEDAVEVANYFKWRQDDAIRNAVSMVGQANFSHRELHGVSTRALREKLQTERGLTMSDFPSECEMGTVCEQVTVLKPVEYMHKKTGERIITDPVERRVWELKPAPRFDASNDGWLSERIPPP